MIIATLIITAYLAAGAWFVSLSLPTNVHMRQEEGSFDPSHFFVLALGTALTWPRHGRAIWQMLLSTKGGVWLQTGPLWPKRRDWILYHVGPTVHVLPRGDHHGHELDEDCACRPTLEPHLVVHEAWDGRA